VLVLIARATFGMGGWPRMHEAHGPEGLLPTGMRKCKSRVPTPPFFGLTLTGDDFFDHYGQVAKKQINIKDGEPECCSVVSIESIRYM